MFSLFELETLCAGEEKLRKFLESYGVLKDVPACECGGSLSGVCKNGPSSYRRCYKCRVKVYGKASSILEGCHLTYKQWLYFWRTSGPMTVPVPEVSICWAMIRRRSLSGHYGSEFAS